MKYLRNKLANFKKQILSIVSKKCKHLNKIEVYRDYSDASIEYKCLDCGKIIYEDMYNY